MAKREFTDRFVYVQNGYDRPIYVSLEVSEGTLHIAVRLTKKEDYEIIPTKHAAVYPIAGGIDQCVHDDTLRYLVLCTSQAVVTERRGANTDGPVIVISPQLAN